MTANVHQRRCAVFRVAVPVPVHTEFDYLAPALVDGQTISPGVRLRVPFGGGEKIGVLLEVLPDGAATARALKPVLRILDEEPLLSATDLALLRWASRYYHHPLGEVIGSALTAALRAGQAMAPAAPSPGQEGYRLTALGHGLDGGQLARAPRQQALLALFKGQGRLAKDDPRLASPAVKAIVKRWLGQHWLRQDLQPVPASPPPPDTALVCNPQQQAALAAITGQLGRFSVFLLAGVTGSGKTEVYMQAIGAVLARGQQALVLVPEINLTPQLQQRFQARFGAGIAVSHSRLAAGQRQRAWSQARQGHCQVLLGTRSALFTPFKRLGLIILDEEHDASFKQQEGFRFSARDVAVMRGKLLGVPVVLGSATPSLESLYNAGQRRYQLLPLPVRVGRAAAPALHLLDIRNKAMDQGLSEPLLARMRTVLARQEQVLLFLNRRGFAPTLICHGCGWVADCPNCDAHLVVHAADQRLSCHHCGHGQALPARCPDCHGAQLTPLGLGTERVERRLAELFPAHTLIRLDRDSTQRKGALERCLAQIGQGQADIILGTQMVAKGHHFPNVTLVALLDVDSGLFSVDFHAQERLAQQIVQVAGRAGREDKPGQVILQTRRPEHPLLTTLLTDGYGLFAKQALAERQQAGLPPFSHQALLRVTAGDADIVVDAARQAAACASACAGGRVRVLGPVAAPLARRAGLHRQHVLMQAARRPWLHAVLNELTAKLAALAPGKRVRWSLDIDPVDFG